MKDQTLTCGSFQEAQKCDCMRLCRPLHQEESLPDHIGPLAYLLSCQAWIWYNIPWGETLLLAEQNKGTPTEIIQPESGAPRDPQCSFIYLPDGRRVKASTNTWPIPLDTGPETPPAAIWMVIQQWVEETPDEKLAALLQAAPNWNSLCLHYPQLIKASSINHLGCEDITTTSIRLLRDHGLPATPNTARYLVKRCQPELYLEHFGVTPVLPSRGCLVSSIAIGPQDASDRTNTTGIDMVSSIPVIWPWSTDQIRRNASSVAHSHHKYWAKQHNAKHSGKRELNQRQYDDISKMIQELHGEEIPPELIKDARAMFGDSPTSALARKRLSERQSYQMKKKLPD